jgi:signal transduction histidine kinase
MAREIEARAHKRPLRDMALALALSAAAFAAQWFAQPLFGGRVPFLFFLPAIALAGAYGGFWPAVLVTLIGASTGIYAIRQGGALMLETSPAAWAALAFIIFASGLLFFGFKLHAASRRASAAELRLRTAEEDAAVGLFEIDVAQDSLFASSGFWQLLGREPLTGVVPLSAWLRGMPPEDVEHARKLLLQPRSRLRTEFEHRVVLQNGESRWVMTRFRAQGPTGSGPDTDELGKLLIRGVMVDITERKEAARALASTRSELEQQVADLNELHELSGRLESTEDLTAQLQQILATLARMHGTDKGLVSLSSADGTRLQLVAQQGFSAAAGLRLADVPMTGGACGTACFERQRIVIEDVETDARFAPFRDFARSEGFRTVHATPLLDHDGERLGSITVHLPHPRAITARERRLADICARKAAVFIERTRAEALAQERDRRFRSVLDASAAGFAVLRPVRDGAGLIHDFHWIYANPAAAAAWERAPGQLIGRNVLDVLPGAWDQGELFDAYVSVARDRQLREFEHRTRQTARNEWFHVIASPLDGDVAVWFTNVTARRRNEQALLEADQRKDEFLATLAHELRNPLAPIRQATQIAMTARASEAQKRWSYAVIERQVQHMSLLLDDLLDISRITRGRLQLRRQNCELREVFSAAVEAARPLLDKKEHQFALDLPAEEI